LELHFNLSFPRCGRHLSHAFPEFAADVPTDLRLRHEPPFHFTQAVHPPARLGFMGQRITHENSRMKFFLTRNI
jgi:hypothetical protein